MVPGATYPHLATGLADEPGLGRSYGVQTAPETA